MEDSKIKQPVPFKSCAVLSSVMKSRTLQPGMWVIPLPGVSTLCVLPGLESPSSRLGHQVDYPGVAVLTLRSSLFYSLMALKHKGSDADSSHMPKKSHKMFPLREKVNVLKLIRGGKIVCWGCYIIHFISSRRHFIILHHHKRKRGEYSTIRYFEISSPHSYSFYLVYYSNCSV